MSPAPSFSLHQSPLSLNEKARERGLIGRLSQDLLLMFWVQLWLKIRDNIYLGSKESGAFI